MNKSGRIAIAMLLSVLAIIGLVACLDRNAVVDDTIAALAIGPRPHAPYLTHYHTETATGNWAVLIDLSDSTNYPHAATNSIILRDVRVVGDLANDMDWKIEIGVVTIADTSGITVEHLAIIPRDSRGAFDGEWTVPQNGLNLLVSSDSLTFVATNSTTGTMIISSTVLIDGVGASAMPAVGDLILYTNEISNGSSMRLSVITAYDTE